MGLVNGHIICVRLRDALLIVALEVTVIYADSVVKVGEHVVVLCSSDRARGLDRGSSLVRARPLLDAPVRFRRRGESLVGNPADAPCPDHRGWTRGLTRRALGLSYLPDI